MDKDIPIRSEKEVFDELAKLCARPGFIHAIAHICLRDNIIVYEGDLKPEDIYKIHSPNRLLRTEISTLIGLLVKAGNIDTNLPEPKELESLVAFADNLLDEIHRAITPDIFAGVSREDIEKGTYDPFKNGKVLRESIFYSAESAYVFQYVEFAHKKYKNDDDWFINNRGFSNETAYKILKALPDALTLTLNYFIPGIKKSEPYTESSLPIFYLSGSSISELTGLDESEVTAFLDSFSIQEDSSNAEFNSISDFNLYNSLPILKVTKGKENEGYIILQLFSLAEAYYTTPFFWFLDDGNYKDTALNNRGTFAENLITDRITHVFGKANVHSNAFLSEKKGSTQGEIDILVTYADRAIVIQAKSKTLTIESRKGNDNQLQDDFKKAIQSAYNQGYICAELLQNPNVAVLDSEQNIINIQRDYKEIYIFCIISDHYPALAFQARQFLEYKETDIIRAPFIMDVFNLDIMSEFLDTPLYFLSYANRRAIYADQVLASHEITILGFHLKKNLWLEDDLNMMMLHDDVSTDLDIAMEVRRGGGQGAHTPDGILTRFNNTTLGGLITDIQSTEHPGVLDLGFLLLHMNEETILNVSTLIDRLAKSALSDNDNHDLTLPIPDGNTGLTIHCNSLDASFSRRVLEGHAKKRQYTQKADSWFGMCVDPASKRLRFCIGITTPWKQSDEMDKLTANAPKLQHIEQILKKPKKKLGRNDPCFCNSGKKYKHCCLRSTQKQ